MTTRSELIGRLGQKMPHLAKAKVEAAVDCILGQITESMISGERIEIRGFGGFSVNLRPPRQARNPKTGEAVQLPAKSVVHFKPGKDMRERVNQPDFGS